MAKRNQSNGEYIVPAIREGEAYNESIARMTESIKADAIAMREREEERVKKRQEEVETKLVDLEKRSKDAKDKDGKPTP